VGVVTFMGFVRVSVFHLFSALGKDAGSKLFAVLQRFDCFGLLFCVRLSHFDIADFRSNPLTTEMENPLSVAAVLLDWCCWVRLDALKSFCDLGLLDWMTQVA